MKQKNNSMVKKSTEPQIKNAKLTDLMSNSEETGREYRKKYLGQDVLKNKIHHPESRAENPKK